MTVDVEQERAAQQALLRRAEGQLDTAALLAIGGWLDVFRYSLLQELGVPEALIAAAGDGGQPVNTAHLDYALDNAVARSWGEWQNRLENQVLPTVGVVFGDAFQQTRRGDPQGAFAHQQTYLANVSDRLKIWPEGAFEDIRPELLEALSDAATINEMTERVGRVLNIDAKSRKLRAQIGEVEARFADPDLDPDERRELIALRRALWEQHDEALNEWQWKARRIARTESHGAVCAGQLAAAKQRQDDTGIRMWKRWLSTDDTRTRASHRVADGQAVPLDQVFRVGGFMLQHPSDSINVAPHEVINCRCTMLMYDDDALQDKFDGQGGRKGDVAPGSVRIGPDDPDEADAAIAEVAEVEQRALPRLGQRGEDAGQTLPAELIDVDVTEDRTPVPAPDVERATDNQLADYLIRTDERERDDLAQQAIDELERRLESDEIEVQFGQPEDAADVLEVDDAGAWLDDPRWADEIPEAAEYEPDIAFEDWNPADELPGDAVPEDVDTGDDNIGGGDDADLLEAAQAAHDAAMTEFADAAESGDDERIEAALLAIDEAESRLTIATQLAEVADVEPEPDTIDTVEPDTQEDAGHDAELVEDEDEVDNWVDVTRSAEWARETWNYTRGDRSTISEVDENAIADYTASSDAINPYLRNRDKLPTDPGIDELVAEIDDAIDRAPRVPETVRVTRVFTSTQPFGTQLNPGDIHVDQGFMSTTIGDDVSPHAAVHMILDVPAGTRAIYAGDLSNYGGAEAELLLGRGTTYVIDRTVPRPDRGEGHVDVHAHVVEAAVSASDREDDLAQQRRNYVELWGEQAAIDEFDTAQEVKLTNAQKKRMEIMEQAEALERTSDLNYEQALAEVQGLSLEQLRRREFVRAANLDGGWVSTNFDDLLAEVHKRNVLAWMIQAEADCNGHLLKPEYRDNKKLSHSMFWEVNDYTSRIYMSEELARWLDEHGGRITQAEMLRMIEDGIDVFDADACLATYATWDLKRRVEDYHR